MKTAFDVIDKGLLIRKLKRIGIKGKMLNMIRDIYKHTGNEIITGEGITEDFETGKGVRQGCLLSIGLFSIFIDDLDDCWKVKNEGGSVVSKLKVFCLKFSDDVVAIANMKEKLDGELRDLEKYRYRNNMEVNAEKTKTIIIRNGGKRKRGQNGY